MKVFVVFYRDYHKLFEGIFSTEEKAENYIKQQLEIAEFPMSKDSYIIDEVEIDYLETNE